jgi:hypothetical protein
MPRRTSVLSLLASGVAGLGAALLFVAEPAAAKAILPRLGGGPAAWGATLLFFQVGLIGGYATVDLALRISGPRAVRIAHLIMLGLAIAVLVQDVPFASAAEPTSPSLLSAFRLLVTQLALPVLALALTAPAVQVRVASASGDVGRGVYTFYAASNVGSLLGLLAYPWLIEPTIPLSLQWTLWRFGIGLLAVAVATLWFCFGVKADRPPEGSATPSPPEPGWAWVVRAAIPAALLAAVTEYCTRDIAPIPLLWVLPLALYLVTWILAFSRRTHRLVRWAAKVQDLAAVTALVLFLDQPFALAGPALALVALVIVGLTQHGALAESAPPAEWLGRFYVRLAVGGAIGTALVVVVAPVVFPLPLETPLVLIAALALGQPAATIWTARGRRRFLAFAVLAMAVPCVSGLTRETALASLSIAAGVIAMRWRTRPPMAALALLAIVVAGAILRLTAPERLGGDHSMLGRFTVRRDSTGTQLVSGSTLHGLEPPTPAGSRPEAALYYARQGAYGEVVSLMDARAGSWSFGVVGLGIGSLACTARPGTRLTFFELNPGVLRLARDTTLFKSLSRCAPDATVRLGDARVALAGVSDRFDLLTLDAFNSDAIPTHLLTREAFALYRERLAPGGVIAFHISNRFLELAPLVAALAHEVGWVAAEALPVSRAADPVSLVALAADTVTLQPLVATGRWDWAKPADRPWRDGWTPLASALHLSRANVFGR